MENQNFCRQNPRQNLRQPESCGADQDRHSFFGGDNFAPNGEASRAQITKSQSKLNKIKNMNKQIVIDG